MNTHTQPPVVSQWSTAALAPAERCASVIEALGKAIVPLGVEIAQPERFAFHMSSVELADGMTLLRQSGSPHSSFRRKRELRRSGDHSFHFMINVQSSWHVEHGAALLLQPGEGILTDSEYHHELILPEAFEVVHVKLSADWVARHLPDPARLVGQRISLQASMGQALNRYTAQLTPQMVAHSAVGRATLAQQFAALLAMAADERGGKAAVLDSRVAKLCDQIRVSMQMRLDQACLSADDVAAELNVPTQTILQALAAAGLSFAALLTSLRVAAARRMLQSVVFRGMPVEEIAARAGFLDARSMRRALR